MCSLRTKQPEEWYSTFELKAARSGQTRSEGMNHGKRNREQERERERERERETEGDCVHWIVIHLVGSCDVNSTDRATLHTLLPINLLKWISNATLGDSTDLKPLSQTHTKTKHTVFISSLSVWRAAVMGFGRDVRRVRGSSSISLSPAQMQDCCVCAAWQKREGMACWH